ncbi:SMI1/KNR4 family protein [Caballeronia sp. S22]|jgi:hypothetical protein|uniref:SMI1/KNR4 family protein n=1 Tax=Caballeronia sp. S22 TaxID=3137182 RepID=UPI003530E2B7
MNDAEMKCMLEQTLADQSRNAGYRMKESPAPQALLQAPVSAADLAALEAHCAHIGIAVPPSFRQFLQISDGVPDYMRYVGMSLRSALEIVESAGSDEEEWDEYDPLHKFVIVAGDTAEFIAFDVHSIDTAGEPAVVWVGLRGDETTYANFEDLLWSQQRFQKDVLNANLADRANLPDD